MDPVTEQTDPLTDALTPHYMHVRDRHIDCAGCDFTTKRGVHASRRWAEHLAAVVRASDTPSERLDVGTVAHVISTARNPRDVPTPSEWAAADAVVAWAASGVPLGGTTREQVREALHRSGDGWIAYTAPDGVVSLRMATPDETLDQRTDAVLALRPVPAPDDQQAGS